MGSGSLLRIRSPSPIGVTAAQAGPLVVGESATFFSNKLNVELPRPVLLTERPTFHEPIVTARASGRTIAPSVAESQRERAREVRASRAGFELIDEPSPMRFFGTNTSRSYLPKTSRYIGSRFIAASR